MFTAHWKNKYIRAAIFPMKYTSNWRRDLKEETGGDGFYITHMSCSSIQQWILQILPRKVKMSDVHQFIHSQESKVQHHACTHSFSPFASMSSYILSIHKHVIFLDIRLQKQEGRCALPGLDCSQDCTASYTDPPQGDSHKKTQRVWIWIWIWRGEKSSQLTSLRKMFKNVKPQNLMLSNILTDNWWSCEKTKVIRIQVAVLPWGNK